MPKYRKKHVIVKVVQWWKDGDHPEVELHRAGARNGNIDTELGEMMVYPGDFIVEDPVFGAFAVPRVIFEDAYELVEDEE